MLAILPSGGKSERFGGIHKELLPIGTKDYVLSNTIRTAQNLGADEFLILSSKEKIHKHIEFINQHHPKIKVHYLLGNWPEMWDAFKSALEYRKESLFIMPDTIVDINIKNWHKEIKNHEITFGLFRTQEPERFSVVQDKRIITKAKLPKKEYKAWGIIHWKPVVADYWLALDKEKPIKHYDEALESAIQHFEYGSVAIEHYNDLGTWGAYLDYIINK